MLVQAKVDLPDGVIGGSYDPSLAFYTNSPPTAELDISAYTEIEVVLEGLDTISSESLTLTPGSGLAVDGTHGKIALSGVDTTQLKPGDYSWYLQWNDGTDTLPQFPVGGQVTFKLPGKP